MDIYSKNIEALEIFHPESAELIKSIVVDENRVKVLKAENGEPRVLYKKDDGEEILIHNAEDPSKCAEQAIDLLGKMGKEGIAVLFGFGLGYFAEEIFKKFEKGHILMVYEAVPELFKTALMTRDLTELLESDCVKIVLGPDADNFSAIHTHQHLLLLGQFWVVKHHPSVKVNEDAYDRFLVRLKEEKRISTSSVGTAIQLGKDFINSFMSNVPQIIRKPGVNKLEDIFKGRPSIVVSAGPSLEKNFHLLKKVKGRAIIIAVDVVLPTLLPAGIVPDFVVAIDPLPENIAVFKDNPELKKVPFICLAQYTPEILSIYPGPVFITEIPGNIVFQWLSKFWEKKGYVECFGGSVAHLGCSAAEFMGSDTIAIIGQDMSYEKKFHAGDTTELLHNFHGEEVPDYTKGAQTIKNIFGEERYTLRSLLAFRTSFENKIKRFEGTFINATEGGIPIEGAKTMRLADFIEEYCDLPAIDTSSKINEVADCDISYNLDGLAEQVTTAKLIFKDIRRNSSKILKHIHKLKKMKENKREESDEFHNILKKAEALIEKVKHPILNIITAYHYRLELYLMQQEMMEIDDIEDKWEKLDRQLERGLNYNAELIEAVDLFMVQLDKIIKAVNREAKVNKILMDESLSKDERSYQAGMIYKRAGLAAQAVKYLKPLAENNDISMRAGSSVRLLIALAEMYIKQFRCYEAIEILERVKTGCPGSGTNREKIIRRADELKKLCAEKIDVWEEKKNKANILVEEAEINYGDSLESGFFYFRINDYEMAEKKYKEALNHYESSDRNDKNRSCLIDAYYGLAHTYIATDKPEEAVTCLEKAIELEPANPLFYRDLGLIAFQNDDMGSAELFFSKAIELAPKEAELYKQLAGIYMSIGERKKAMALYEDALLVINDDPDIQRDLAMIYKETIADAEVG